MKRAPIRFKSGTVRIIPAGQSFIVGDRVALLQRYFPFAVGTVTRVTESHPDSCGVVEVTWDEGGVMSAIGTAARHFRRIRNASEVPRYTGPSGWRDNAERARLIKGFGSR